MKNILAISGVTTDRVLTISGVYYFYGTIGLPLDLLVDYFRDSRLVIDWDDFIRSAIAEGMKISTLRAKLQNIMSDGFMRRFDEYIEVLKIYNTIQEQPK